MRFVSVLKFLTFSLLITSPEQGIHLLAYLFLILMIIHNNIV